MHGKLDRDGVMTVDQVRGTLVLYATPEKATRACEEGERVVMVRLRWNTPETG